MTAFHQTIICAKLAKMVSLIILLINTEFMHKHLPYVMYTILFCKFLIFSLQTSLALVLVFCAFVSLSDSYCFRKDVKAGK